jgi:hypothetical protein
MSTDQLFFTLLGVLGVCDGFFKLYLVVKIDGIDSRISRLEERTK